MSKLWTIPSLFVLSGVLVVACSTGGEVSGKSSGDDDSVVSQLPLSEGCASCAGDAIGDACGEALDACVADADCLDVDGCFEGCDPNDAGCFASCAAASALFENLVECVVCDACADACEGEWSCGGGDDGGDGEEDGGDGEEDGGDGDGEEDGGGDGEEDGGGDGEEDGGGDGEEDGGGDGEEDGGGDGEEDGGGDGEGDVSQCLSCLETATEGECAQAVEACLSNDGCHWVAMCVQECGMDQECAAHCIQEGEGNELVQAVLECALCGACDEQCPVDPYCG